jgi:hypothetical protein
LQRCNGQCTFRRSNSLGNPKVFRCGYRARTPVVKISFPFYGAHPLDISYPVKVDKKNFPAGQPHRVRYNLRTKTNKKLLTYRRERETFYCRNMQCFSTSEHNGLHYNIGSSEHTLAVIPHFTLPTYFLNNILVVLIYSCLSFIFLYNKTN